MATLAVRTVGPRRVYAVDADPNGSLTGVAGDWAMSTSPKWWICAGGTTWTEMT